MSNMTDFKALKQINPFSDKGVEYLRKLQCINYGRGYDSVVLYHMGEIHPYLKDYYTAYLVLGSSRGLTVKLLKDTGVRLSSVCVFSTSMQFPSQCGAQILSSFSFHYHNEDVPNPVAYYFVKEAMRVGGYSGCALALLSTYKGHALDTLISKFNAFAEQAQEKKIEKIQEWYNSNSGHNVYMASFLKTEDNVKNRVNKKIDKLLGGGGTDLIDEKKKPTKRVKKSMFSETTTSSTTFGFNNPF